MKESISVKYEYAKQMLKTELEILIHSFEQKHGYMPVEHIKSRIKSIQSIERKKRLSIYKRKYRKTCIRYHRISNSCFLYIRCI